MTGDLENAIESAKAHHLDRLRAFEDAVNTVDPVERFRRLESFTQADYVLSNAAKQAIAHTIEEIRTSKDSPSLKTIGLVLGVSGQRVHQLMNPDYRRKANGKRRDRT